MLDKEDLQAIAALVKDVVKEEVTASEQRIMKNVSVLMDAEFKPRFDLLAEGQQAILDKLVSRDDVEVLDRRVDTLEIVV